MHTSAFPWKRLLRNAEGGSTGGEPAAPAPSAAPAGNASTAPAAPSSAALAVNDALAGVGEKTNTEGDAKPEGEAGKEGEDQPKEGDAPAPQIEYTDFTLPAEYQVVPEALDAAKNVFQELNLPQEHAQKIIDAYVKIDGMVNQAWIQDIEGQFEQFTKDTEFYQNGKLTSQAEQAYGKIRALSDNTAKFVDFLNKNGGLFHPGFAEIVKGYAAGLTESTLKGGEPGQNADSWKGFYSKSNHN